MSPLEQNGAGVVHSPPLVFLDEPTSGLDAFSALCVMESGLAIGVAHQLLRNCESVLLSFFMACEPSTSPCRDCNLLPPLFNKACCF